MTDRRNVREGGCQPITDPPDRPPAQAIRPEAVNPITGSDLDRFVITVHGSTSPLRPYWATLTHGVMHVGEPGAGIWRGRTRQRCLRNALRMIATIAADHGLEGFRVEVRDG